MKYSHTIQLSGFMWSIMSHDWLFTKYVSLCHCHIFFFSTCCYNYSTTSSHGYFTMETSDNFMAITATLPHRYIIISYYCNNILFQLSINILTFILPMRQIIAIHKILNSFNQSDPASCIMYDNLLYSHFIILMKRFLNFFLCHW